MWQAGAGARKQEFGWAGEPRQGSFTFEIAKMAKVTGLAQFLTRQVTPRFLLGEFEKRCILACEQRGELAMPSANPFRAFVSYCHADAAFAARLQRQLEAYRLPKRLAASVEPLPGQAPGRIGPVFRDRADLSAAQDLSAAVREAIARSSALIVVASPEAAQSIWVGREIDLFRELHPGAPILAALVRGEPDEVLPESAERRRRRAARRRLPPRGRRQAPRLPQDRRRLARSPPRRPRPARRPAPDPPRDGHHGWGRSPWW